MIQNRKNTAQVILLTVIAVLVYGFVGYLEQEPPFDSAQGAVQAVAKSGTQERIETMLPEPVAKAIAERAAYPRTMAGIAHTESRGNHHAIGDGGKAKGLFQVWGSLHGAVPDDIEGQVDQANRLFLKIVALHGYRTAVALWNGSPSNPKVKQYQRIVLAKVQTLESSRLSR
ncbi:MAG: hypothetical protein WCI45_00140 [Desulfuromonadales bacterium]